MKRILWLATADARGHLMRCQLLAHALRARGVHVDVVTTSEEGRAFLAAFGIDADLVSPHYRVEFNARQDMSRLRTEWRVFRYFTSPRRFLRDLHWLRERASGVDLVVNDSFHPALLVAPFALPPIVHVYGTHLRRALEDNFKARVPAPLATFFAAQMSACAERAFARIEHSLDAPAAARSKRSFVLPPVVALPTKAAASTARIAVAYLNPHFRDPAIAGAIEGAVAAQGLTLYGVAEGYAHWRPYDAHLADHIAAAEVFISAPGMGALAQARELGVPMLALVTDQPEQSGNVKAAIAAGQNLIAVACDGPNLQMRLDAALGRLRGSGRKREPQSTLPAWLTVFEQLLGEERPSMKPTTALVLETNNLQGGGANADKIAATLAQLLLHLRPQAQGLDELVITHDGLIESQRTMLQNAAQRAIIFVETSAGYYEAKKRGFDATSAEVVAFGDADCVPEPDWLTKLLAPFADPATQVSAGRTTYRDDLLGIAATTIDFMYFPSPLGKDKTRNFYANNVAFRRQVFATHAYAPMEGVYRGHCQVLGLRLQSEGIAIHFVPGARTIHRFPDSTRELLQLRWRRGRDSVELTPHLASSYLPRRLQRLGKARALSLGVLAVRFACSVRAIGRQDMSEARGLRRLACVGAIAGISAVDLGGALDRLVRSTSSEGSLSYHSVLERHSQ